MVTTPRIMLENMSNARIAFGAFDGASTDGTGAVVQKGKGIACPSSGLL